MLLTGVCRERMKMFWLVLTKLTFLRKKNTVGSQNQDGEQNEKVKLTKFADWTKILSI
jgi:hypothetical protein